MAELIEKEKAIAAINRMVQLPDSARVQAMGAVSLVKAVDAEPVKHGRWLVRQYGNNPGDYACTCSECKTEGSILWKRCPLCEAKMDKEN